ncbi:MAG: DUF1993 domain-containing protein, partial [Caulobacteraceae bacterium]
DWAAAKSIEPMVLFTARLAPDMFPLSRQVQIASDTSRGAAARLAGEEMPSWPDEEATFFDLSHRITRTRDYLKDFSASRLEGSESREVVLKMREGELKFTGESFLFGFAIPNFFFHLATAYDILRFNGVDLGKRDFLGAV